MLIWVFDKIYTDNGQGRLLLPYLVTNTYAVEYWVNIRQDISYYSIQMSWFGQAIEVGYSIHVLRFECELIFIQCCSQLLHPCQFTIKHYDLVHASLSLSWRFSCILYLNPLPQTAQPYGRPFGLWSVL